MTRRPRAPLSLLALTVLGACSTGDPARTAPLARDVASASTTSAVLAVPTSTTSSPARAPLRLPRGRVDSLTELAATLTEAETAIAAGRAPITAWAHRQQRAYLQIAADPGALPAVLGRVPARVRPAVRANAEASIELRALLTDLRDDLPAWRIVPPAPAAELRRHYAEGERRFGVPWAYLAAVHLVETRMGRIRGLSTAGAQGPMQFMPETWAAYGEGDINDDRDAIVAAARYLSANGAPRDLPAALFRYNHSQHYVRAVTGYAERMLADEHAFLAYHQWQVWYLTTGGLVLLPEGWDRPSQR